MDKEFLFALGAILVSIIIAITFIFVEYKATRTRKLIIQYWSAALLLFIAILLYILYKYYTAP